MELPSLYLVRQPLDMGEIEDVAAVVRDALDSAALGSRIEPGMEVALLAGSRGIDRIEEVLSAAAGWVRERGGKPFILAAMGSHGGSTACGMLEVLEKLGITEKRVGAPVKADVNAVKLGEAAGVEVYASERAARAGAIIAINRIKPHTSFRGQYESGIAKMLAVGLGLWQGAASIHSRGAAGLPGAVPAAARLVIERLPLIAGLALIENGFDRLKIIRALPAERIMEDEPALLDTARSLMPALPFAEAHLLVVDRIGKDISGTGMDTNVIGRRGIAGMEDIEKPRIKRVVALRLSRNSGGNAYGIGLADITTRALIKDMDPGLAMKNALASTFLERARTPLAMPSDREAVEAALATCNSPGKRELKIARIGDTAHLAEMLLTKPLVEQCTRTIRILEGPLEWEFDKKGNLAPMELDFQTKRREEHEPAPSSRKSSWRPEE